MPLARTTSAVRSVEPSSTTRTSKAARASVWRRSASSSAGRRSAPSFVGTTTETLMPRPPAPAPGRERARRPRDRAPCTARARTQKAAAAGERGDAEGERHAMQRVAGQRDLEPHEGHRGRHPDGGRRHRLAAGERRLRERRGDEVAAGSGGQEREVEPPGGEALAIEARHDRRSGGQRPGHHEAGEGDEDRDRAADGAAEGHVVALDAQGREVRQQRRRHALEEVGRAPGRASWPRRRSRPRPRRRGRRRA